MMEKAAMNKLIPMARERLEQEQQIRTRAEQALRANRDYLGKTGKTAADHAAQVEALTRQNQGIIRMLLGDYSGTD